MTNRPTNRQKERRLGKFHFQQLYMYVNLNHLFVGVLLHGLTAVISHFFLAFLENKCSDVRWTYRCVAYYRIPITYKIKGWCVQRGEMRERLSHLLLEPHLSRLLLPACLKSLAPHLILRSPGLVEWEISWRFSISSLGIINEFTVT